jgi:carotenoid cleavage dioxygenase-like enzyme
MAPARAATRGATTMRRNATLGGGRTMGRAMVVAGRDAGRRRAVQTRAVQTPMKPAEERESTEEAAPFEREYKDYATGYASVPGLAYENMGWVTEVEGEIPKEMVGTLLRNGPAMYERDGFVKSYLDGDGMVTSIAIKDGKAYFRNKFVRTEHFDKEEELGKYTEPSIFTASDPRKPAFFYRLFNDILGGDLSRKQNGAYNVLNWGDSLVAVDYKKPYALNPDTLETIGHGACDLSSVMHTSHYRTVTEPDGSRRCVAFLNEVDWRANAGVGTTKAVFYEFDEQGKEVSRRAYDYPASYVHDLVVTENYYILFDCPIKIDFPAVFTKYIFERSCLSELICEDTERRPLFRIFPRRGDSREVQTAPADYWCYAYHHVNGFEDKDGNVVFDTCTWDKFTLYFTDICNPNGKDNYPRMKLSRFLIDMKKLEAKHTELSDVPCELPITSWDYTGAPYEHMYLSTSVGRTAEGVNGPMQALTKASLKSDGDKLYYEEQWVPGDRKFAMEPFFVPRPGGTAEDDGWVVALVHDAAYDKSTFGGRGTEMVIIDAQKFSEGPVARLRLPTYVPFGVHGSWSPKYVAGPPKEDELARLAEMRARNDGKAISLGASAAEPVIHNTPTPQAIGLTVAGIALGITAFSTILQ